MADIKHSQIEIQVNLELVAQIKWLMKYKAAADEALSYLITNEKDAHAAQLILTALNIGAHEQPAQHRVQRTANTCRYCGSSENLSSVCEKCLA